MKSWKTTLFGSMTGLGASLMGINLVPQLHGVIPEAWVGTTMFIGFLMTVIGPVLNGAFARDNNVTSEAAGAVPPADRGQSGSDLTRSPAQSSLRGPLTLFLCLALPLGFAATLPIGCTTSQQTIAFKTLKSVQDASVAGLKIYGAAYRKGDVDDATRVHVHVLYGRYQAAFELAIDAARFNYNAPAPPDLTAACNDLLALIALLKH